ncbi:MAG: ferredoxin [Paludibacteraceae bacterium]
MNITKVWMEEGCTSCGLCESTCPEVFRVEDIAYVNEGVNYSEYSELIKEASENCPVEVIKYSE